MPNTAARIPDATSWRFDQIAVKERARAAQLEKAGHF
jgi:hypothetical protein